MNARNEVPIIGVRNWLNRTT